MLEVGALAFLFLGVILFYLPPNIIKQPLQALLSSARAKQPVKAKPASATKADTKEREWGTWIPETFTYPTIEEWKDFNVDEVEPIPYRPFRWGPNYPINLGIGPMSWSNWLELDNRYRKTIEIRKERTATRKEKAHRTMPGFMPHAEETLAEMCAFLSQRYPKCFTVTRVPYNKMDPSTYGDSIAGETAGAIASITNHITGDHFDFVQLRKEEGEAWDPMKYAGLLQQDDLAIMVEDKDGHYRFQSGSVCTAGFWRLEDKIGRTLDEIHMRGKVPQFKEKLKFSMERFFQKQKVSAPVRRNNYFFQIDDNLSWSDDTVGPEDVFDQETKGPKESVATNPELAGGFSEPKATDDFDKVWYRSERQSLRRMPRTGCILFTVRTYFHPVHELAKEPGVPGRMASAIRSWPADVNEYKGGPLYTNVVLPRLDELHQRQIAEGIVKLDENGEVVGKNVNTYPF